MKKILKKTTVRVSFCLTLFVIFTLVVLVYIEQQIITTDYRTELNRQDMTLLEKRITLLEKLEKRIEALEVLEAVKLLEGR